MTYVLYAVTVLLWGSSFYGITFQLGTVAPEASVTYRFALSAVVIFGFCFATGRSLRFGWRNHALFAALGTFLFSLNYISIYLSELYIASGLTAVSEVVGDAGVLLKDPYSSAEMASQIDALYHDHERRYAMMERGLVQANKFSWQNTFRGTEDVIRRFL